MFDKPLFSRRQLNVIIVVTTIAIVLLTATGKPQSLPEISLQQLAGVAVYQLESDEPDTRISLSFALPENPGGVDAEAILARKLLFSSLSTLSENTEFQRFGARIGLRSHSDRVQMDLSLQHPADTGPLLDLLIPQLLTPLDSQRWQQLLKKHRAEQYLQQQSSDPERLRLQAWLAGSDAEAAPQSQRWPGFRNRLLSREQLSIALMTPQPAQVSQALGERLKLLPQQPRWPPSSAAQTQPRRQSSSGLVNHRLLLGRHTRGRTDADFALELVSVRQVQTLARELGLDSQWIPLASRSPLTLQLTTGDKITAEQVIERLRQRLKQLSEDQLDAHRQQLLEQLYANISSPESLFDQLESIAFYRQPVDYLDSFVAQLDQLSSTDIRTRSEALLDLQQFHQILRSPSP